MPTFTLTEQEFQQLVNVVANAAVPWVVSNPLLTKLGQQAQAQERQQSPVLMRGNAHGDSDSDQEPGVAGTGPGG